MFKRSVRFALVLLVLSVPVLANDVQTRQPRVRDRERDPNPIVRIVKKAIRTLSDLITVPKP